LSKYFGDTHGSKAVLAEKTGQRPFPDFEANNLTGEARVRDHPSLFGRDLTAPYFE